MNEKYGITLAFSKSPIYDPAMFTSWSEVLEATNQQLTRERKIEIGLLGKLSEADQARNPAEITRLNKLLDEIRSCIKVTLTLMVAAEHHLLEGATNVGDA